MLEGFRKGKGLCVRLGLVLGSKIILGLVLRSPLVCCNPAELLWSNCRLGYSALIMAILSLIIIIHQIFLLMLDWSEHVT